MPAAMVECGIRCIMQIYGKEGPMPTPDAHSLHVLPRQEETCHQADRKKSGSDNHLSNKSLTGKRTLTLCLGCLNTHCSDGMALAVPAPSPHILRSVTARTSSPKATIRQSG